jgi:hypothetical protein
MEGDGMFWIDVALGAFILAIVLAALHVIVSLWRND